MKRKKPSVVSLGVVPGDRERLRIISAQTGKKIYALIHEMINICYPENAEEVCHD